MVDLVKTDGILIYDPVRTGMKSAKNYWCVLQLGLDFVKYYQELIRMEKFINLCMPAWGAHVSIVRGEVPLANCISRWKEHNNKRFIIEYETDIKIAKDSKNDGQFYYVDAYSDELMKIRKDLGLPVHKKFHITIGRTYY